MAYNSREIGGKRNKFRGLHTTTKGATAPQGSFEDLVNIDLQNEDVRGRAASEKLIAAAMPDSALFYDGEWRYCVADTAIADCALDQGTTAGMRVYFSGIDKQKLLGAATGTRWCIAECSGPSTDITAPTQGWTLYIQRTSATELTIEMKLF